MKIADTRFIVCVNKAFVDKLRVGMKQITWFVREAARDLDVSEWEVNAHADEKDGLTCWYHPMLIYDCLPGIVEAIPHPRGYLLLNLRGDPATTPWPLSKDVLQALYPEDFAENLNKTQKELKVFHTHSEVLDGQNRHGGI